MKYSIERFGFQHLENIKKLHESIYGWSCSIEELKKKYSTQSVGVPAIGYLAFDLESNAVAYYGVFPLFLIMDGKKILAAQSGDTMTHVDHQGKGLFTILARHTYESAAAEGISFIFGFPNKNSYRGFVNKLGWTHNITMHSYNFWVPTFPLKEITRKVKPAEFLFDGLKRLVFEIFQVTTPETIENSVLKEGIGGVLRNEEYLNYKNSNLYCLNSCNVKIYFKINKFIDIGDIYIFTDGNLISAMWRLKMIAFFLGIFRIRFYVTPETSIDCNLKKNKNAKKGLPYGHLAFDSNINPDDFAFTYLDYDTF